VLYNKSKYVAYLLLILRSKKCCFIYAMVKT